VPNIRQTERETKLAGLIERELSQAEGRGSDVTDAARKRALDAFNCAPLPDDKARVEAGLSVVQDSSFRDMVHACAAQMLPMLSTDAVVQFEPDGEQDEDAARAESAAVEHVVMSKNNGFVEFEEAILDALTLRNGWVKVWVETSETKGKVPLTGDERPELVAALLAPKTIHEKRELVEGGIRVTTTRQTFRVAAVPAENMSWGRNARSSDVEELGFLAEYLPMTRSDLVERGVSKAVAEALPASDAERPEAGRARKRGRHDDRRDAASRDQDVIDSYEVHLRADLDGDGIGELWRILYASRYVLEAEQVDTVPYGTGSPFLVAHRLEGLSLWDVLDQVQATKTEFLRLSVDNTRHLTHGRWAVDDTRTNLNDVLNSGPVIRTKGSPSDAVIPAMTPIDLGPTLLSHLGYQDKLRTERGGASLEMQSAELQIAGETAHGVERQTSLREMLTSHMARNLAETLIRRTYLLVHRYLRLYANEPIAMKLQGQWVQVDPRQWRARDRVNVRAGLSAGEKLRKMGAMQQLIGYQVQAMQAGLDGVLTDLSSGYNAMMDWAAAADVDNPGLYFINPASPQAQQAQAQKQQASQEQQQQLQQIMMGQFQVEMEKIRAEIAQKQEELAFKYWDARLKSETEEAKVVATGTIDLQKAQLQGESREAATAAGAEGRAARVNGAAR